MDLAASAGTQTAGSVRASGANQSPAGRRLRSPRLALVAVAAAVAAASVMPRPATGQTQTARHKWARVPRLFPTSTCCSLAAGQPQQSAAFPPSRRYGGAGQSSTADQHIHTAITRRCDSGLRQSDRFWRRQYGLRFDQHAAAQAACAAGFDGQRTGAAGRNDICAGADIHVSPAAQSLRRQEGRCRPSFTRPGPPHGWAPRCRRGPSRCR